MIIIYNLILISYFLRVFELFPIGSYGFTFIDLSIILFLLLFIKRTIWNGDNIYILKRAFLISLISLFFSAIISGFNPLISHSSADLIQFIKSFSHFAFFIAFALVVSIYPIGIETLKKSLKLWLILSILINIFGAYQIYARAFDMPLAWVEITNSSFNTRGTIDNEGITQLSLKFKNFYRATSIFSEPSALAAFNLIILSFTLIPKFIFNKTLFKSNLILNLILFSSLIALFLTFSLTAVAGVGIILSVMLLLENKTNLKSYIKYSIFGILIIVIADRIIYSYAEISVLELFFKRLYSIFAFGTRGVTYIEGESFGTRLESAMMSFDIWKYNIFFGTGMGLTFANGYFLSFSDYSFLHALVELGIFGALAFTSLLILITIQIYKIRKKLNLKRLNSNTKLEYSTEEILLSSSFYMMLILIFLNHFTTNNLIGAELWVPLSIPIILILNYYIKENKGITKINLSNISMKNKIESKLYSLQKN